jgi:hypothetical protein
MGTQTYTFTGDWAKFNVPAGVKIVECELRGGGSGSREGGKVTGKIRVDGKDVLWIMVGKQAFLRDGRKGGQRCFGGGGAGGDGSAGRQGGNGGGGATAIRMNAQDGRIMAVAGGAGGNSGDTGNGGQGGADIGQGGADGDGTGSGNTSQATGGTQNQPGKGGTTSGGTKFWGLDGTGGRLGRGGKGGMASSGTFTGGGGGGGGYYPGGGGQAGVIGEAPGGGGAGGSNYTDGLFSVTSQRGGGGVDNGRVILTWEDPGGNEPPTPPVDIKINGDQIQDGLATKSTGSVIVRGQPKDPDKEQDLRMVIHLSDNKEFTKHSTWRGTYDPVEQRDKVTIDGLSQNTRYYLRIYTQDHRGKMSTAYRATNFWTNRRPDPPALTQPAENVMFVADMNMTFIWNHADPDPGDPQAGWRMRYRKAARPLEDPGEWTLIERENDSTEQWVIDAGTFKANVFYEWTVKTKDAQGQWGEWQVPKSFFIEGVATPPELLEPIKAEAIVAAEANRFRWKFKAPVATAHQTRADLRYRVIGTETWTTLFGDITTPGNQWYWDIPAETFAPSYRYEWQVRTYSTTTTEVSDWSESATFWTTVAPGSGAGVIVVESGQPQSPLGIGDNKVYVYDRGGTVYRGEITPMTDLRWGRKRDDMDKALIHVDQWDEDQRAFYATLRTWMHEVVIFRDGVRVWEGPITRISSQGGRLEIEAQDVMAYVYRRIMRQGYNDAYRIINGEQMGQRTVVERASRIIMNALSYDDPNVLGYLTPINSPFDARTTRVRKDYSRTAWEEIDDLAAHAGLDYSVSGRRIILFDTHNPIGRLPEMRDGDFSDPPIVTEYGMSYANYFGVTNNDGVWGAALPSGVDPAAMPGPTGWIEQLASNYGDNEQPGSTQKLTKEGLKVLRQSFREQARRNISGRYPAPLVVRIPDNSTLNPHLNLGINQLVPGVWIPLRATGTIREVSQWQKLDSVTVTQDGDGEKIAVVMSPAPNEGQDPDADLAAVEEL